MDVQLFIWMFINEESYHEENLLQWLNIVYVNFLYNESGRAATAYTQKNL
jgi:hypothetical protein